MTEKILLLYSALLDKRTPWYAKVLTGLVLAYVISPIDIIPDFIPVIGLLDEMILVPIAFWFIFRMIPESVKAETVTEMDINSRKRLLVIGVILVLIVWAICLFISYQYFIMD